MEDTIDDRRRVSALMQAVILYRSHPGSESMVLGTAEVFYEWLRGGVATPTQGSFPDDDMPF